MFLTLHVPPLQFCLARADLREPGEGPGGEGDLLVLLCESSLVLRGEETSLPGYTSAGPPVAQEGIDTTSLSLLKHSFGAKLENKINY